jgi:hypothetical protein
MKHWAIVMQWLLILEVSENKEFTNNEKNLSFSKYKFIKIH